MENSEKKIQTRVVLEDLLDAKGAWVNGRHFLHERYFSQFHARIKELEKEGWPIEHSPFKDEFKFISYRIIPSGRVDELREREFGSVVDEKPIVDVPKVPYPKLDVEKNKDFVQTRLSV